MQQWSKCRSPELPTSTMKSHRHNNGQTPEAQNSIHQHRGFHNNGRHLSSGRPVCCSSASLYLVCKNNTEVEQRSRVLILMSIVYGVDMSQKSN